MLRVWGLCTFLRPVVQYNKMHTDRTRHHEDHEDIFRESLRNNANNRLIIIRMFTLHRLIAQAIHQQATVTREQWLDTQIQIQDIEMRVIQQNAPSEMKFLQTSREPLSLERLFETMIQHKPQIQYLALMGMLLSYAEVQKLRSVLLVCGIEELQMGRFTCQHLETLALDCHLFRDLKKLRLTMDDSNVDWNESHTLLLFDRLKHCSQLAQLHIIRIDLSASSTIVNSVVEFLLNQQAIEELSLKECLIDNEAALQMISALRQHGALRKLDWTLNRISDISVLISLLQFDPLEHIVLSNNGFSSVGHGVEALSQAISQNKNCEGLELNMNPLQDDMISAILQGLERGNYVLKSLGLITKNLRFRSVLHRCLHMVALNREGRGLVRHFSNNNRSFLLYPRVLARVNHDPSLLYGLIRENLSVLCG